jgi:hypothetical protein
VVSRVLIAPFLRTWEICEFKSQSAFRDKFPWSMTKVHKSGVISLAFVLRLFAAYFIAWTATYLYLTPYRSQNFSHYFRGSSGPGLMERMREFTLGSP